MNTKLGCLVLLLLSCALSFEALAQHDTTGLQFQIPGAFRLFEVDQLGQVYTISQDDELIKYSAQGKPLFRYHNTTLGQLQTLDVRDPFNILLFFQAQQTIVLLDRTLSDRATIDLRTTAIQNASAVALSLDNDIWVYDDFANQLLKLNATGAILQQSDDLRLTQQINSSATAIGVAGNQVFLHIPDRGLAVFSNFLQFQKWLPIEDVNRIRFHERFLLCHTLENCFYLLPQNAQQEQIPNPPLSSFLEMEVENGNRYFLTNEALLVYSLQAN